MRIFPSLPEEPGLGEVFRRFPHTLPPLLDYHDRLLRDASPLTVAQRELIAAYVSGLNDCTFCHGAHVQAAEAYGIEPALFSSLLADVDTAPVEDAMKPVLRYVRKLTLSPSRIVAADAEAVFRAGWEEQALFDAISVCALFNFMNRIVDGSGVKRNPLLEAETERRERLERHRKLDAGVDPYRSNSRYSRYMGLWGIPPDV